MSMLQVSLPSVTVSVGLIVEQAYIDCGCLKALTNAIN
ncbi:hypothetical protein RRG08_010575 [Elysia crispata]|uniref:Uncharacterized protein n=1 Tax=Elysia crispata TaxID=231223 RepID=A0AAE0ZVH6_9GAST|nr:hypothetical protein RRG08_010575 [Elysia crispata]